MVRHSAPNSAYFKSLRYLFKDHELEDSEPAPDVQTNYLVAARHSERWRAQGFPQMPFKIAIHGSRSPSSSGRHVISSLIRAALVNFLT